MRTKKVEGLTIGWNGDEGSASGYYTEVMTLNAPTERYWYDGQMAHEEDRTFKVGSTTYKNVTKYGLGARGSDYIHHWDDQTDTTTVGFPIYDGHGNMIATLSRAGSSPYYSTGNLRLYDVWGSVRSGSSSGLPNQRYCANLGHRQDDESSLIYMRARYYEPNTGRFICEDTARDGWNWTLYCGNDPVHGSDPSGNFTTNEIVELLKSPAFHAALTATQIVMLIRNSMKSVSAALVAIAGLTFLAGWFGEQNELRGRRGMNGVTLSAMFTLGLMAIVDLTTLDVLGEAGTDVKTKAKAVCANYAIILMMFIRLEIWEEAHL